MPKSAPKPAQRIAKITLDERTVIRRSADIEHDRAIAISDLLEENSFVPASGIEGPFHLHLAIAENRLVLDIRDAGDQPLEKIALSLAPFRGLVKDYFILCESYYNAVKTTTPTKLEIDRHGPPLRPQRGRRAPARDPVGPGGCRFSHRAAVVHAALRAAYPLNGYGREGA